MNFQILWVFDYASVILEFPINVLQCFCLIWKILFQNVLDKFNWINCVNCFWENPSFIVTKRQLYHFKFTTFQSVSNYHQVKQLLYGFQDLHCIILVSYFSMYSSLGELLKHNLLFCLGGYWFRIVIRKVFITLLENAKN